MKIDLDGNIVMLSMTTLPPNSRNGYSLTKLTASLELISKKSYEDAIDS